MSELDVYVVIAASVGTLYYSIGTAGGSIMVSIRAACSAGLVLLWCLGSPPAVRGCDCGGVPGVCESFTYSAAVFTGRVLSHDDGVTEFAVLESFGSALGAKVTLGAKGLGFSDCDYPFKVGGSYLVFAHEDHAYGAMRTTICGRTAPVESSTGDLAYLRRVLAAKSGATGAVEGVVRAFEHNPAGGRAAGRLNPVPGVTVRIKGPAGSYKAITNAKGEFRIENVLMGEYEAHADVPATYHLPSPRRFRVWDPQACGELRLDGLWPREK